MVGILASLLKLGLPYLTEKVLTEGKKSAESYIKKHVGLDVDLSKPSQIAKEDIAKLRELDELKLKKEAELNRHVEEVRKMGYAHEETIIKLDNEDRADARDLTKESLKSKDKFVRRFTYYFIAFWSFFSASYLCGVTFLDIPKNNAQTVHTILGFILGTAIAAMFAFLLGSSHSSKEHSAENKRLTDALLKRSSDD